MTDHATIGRRRLKVVCVGSLNMDLLVGIDRLPEEHEKRRCQSYTTECGGSAANTAFWLAKLGHEVAMVGCVGRDYFGQQCVEGLKQAGVNCSCVFTVSDSSTGVAIVLFNGHIKRIITTGGANRVLQPDMLPTELIDADTHLHVATSNHAVAKTILEVAKARGASCSSDVNDAGCVGRLSLLDLCIINNDDLQRWLGSSFETEWDRLFDRKSSAPALIVTNGEKGAYYYQNGVIKQVPTVPVTPVDRTGGGDAFCAGVLHRYVDGCDLPSCIAFGLQLARGVIGGIGSRPASALPG